MTTKTQHQIILEHLNEGGDMFYKDKRVAQIYDYPRPTEHNIFIRLEGEIYKFECNYNDLNYDFSHKPLK